MQRQSRSGVSRKPVGSGETSRPSEESHLESALENPYSNAIRSPRAMGSHRQSSSSDQFYDVESPTSYHSQKPGYFFPTEVPNPNSYEHLPMPSIRSVTSRHDSLQSRYSNNYQVPGAVTSSGEVYAHPNASWEYYSAPQGPADYPTDQYGQAQPFYPEAYPAQYMGQDHNYTDAYHGSLSTESFNQEPSYEGYYSAASYQQYPPGASLAYPSMTANETYDDTPKYGYIYDNYSQGDDAYPVSNEEVLSGEPVPVPLVSMVGSRSSVGETEDGADPSLYLEASASEPSLRVPRELQPSPTLESVHSVTKDSPPPSQHTIDKKSSFVENDASNNSDAAIGVGTGSEYVRKIRLGAAETTASKRPTRLPIGINAGKTKTQLRAPPEFLSKAMDIRYMHLQPRMLASEVDDDDVGPLNSSPAQTNTSSQTTEREAAAQPESPSESVVEDMGKIKLFVANPDED